MKYLYLLILLLVSFSITAYPTITPYVNDFANILNEQEEHSLQIIAEEIEKNTSVEIAIVTLESTLGEDRVMYATKIGEENGVGKKSFDNGVILLWSLGNEKGGAIATGRGIESTLNDAKVGRIGRESRTYFDNDKYYEGFEFVLVQINRELGNVVAPEPSDRLSNAMILLIVLIALILGIWLIFIFGSSSSYRSSSYIGRSSSGWSSGGGISFGGGSFGGGGGRF